jgi:glycosyltransferase involved in cell wall biosynthesis
MKKPIRLAVLFDQKIHAGGGYQQALNAALQVKRLPTDLVEPVYFTTVYENLSNLAKFGVVAHLIRLNIFMRVWLRLHATFGDYLLFRFLKIFQVFNYFEIIFLKAEIDLIYFLSPNAYAQTLEKLNYITTVWDLCHRDYPEFPEVRWNREFEIREAIYRSILPRAFAVLVDSDLGKHNIVKRYGTDETRVHVMPFEASQGSRSDNTINKPDPFNVLTKYQLIHPYVFYPAQFWAHKNHVYLLEGLKELELLYGVKLSAIFSGSDKGNMHYIAEYANELFISDRVRFAGFVSDEEMTTLYKQSVALVMPTYFGPTNLPPIEAFELGVPVLYPDTVGLREQVDGAALLLDLKRPRSLASQLFRLLSEPNLKNQLVKAGKQRISYLNQIDRTQILQSILEEFICRRITWA